MYQICVSIAVCRPHTMLQKIKLALEKSELVEIRLDFLAPEQVPYMLNLAKKYLDRSICTLRPKSEGGRFSGSEKERISILKLIAEYDPFMLDVEYNTLKKSKTLYPYLKKTKTRILVSWHDFEKTPSTGVLIKRFDMMAKFSKNIKIVTTAHTLDDSARVLGLYQIKKKNKLVAFSMGGMGRLSRVMCLYLGSPFTYASLGRPVAAGQFRIDELQKMQNMNQAKHAGQVES